MLRCAAAAMVIVVTDVHYQLQLQFPQYVSSWDCGARRSAQGMILYANDSSKLCQFFFLNNFVPIVVVVVAGSCIGFRCDFYHLVFGLPIRR